MTGFLVSFLWRTGQSNVRKAISRISEDSRKSRYHNEKNLLEFVSIEYRSNINRVCSIRRPAVATSVFVKDSTVTFCSSYEQE